jgi:hypothetical protein
MVHSAEAQGLSRYDYRQEPTMSDDIVDEVRKAREEYARRFNFELHAMCADLRRQQALSQAPIVSLPKRPVRDTVPRQPTQLVRTEPNVEADA